jgi:DNA repair protein RadC
MKENAVDMSTLSTPDLVSELLSPDRRVHPADALRVADAESFYGSATARDTLLNHKLGAARELILRELRAKMRSGPVMGSPQTIRDWLRLYCAGLEHEVFLALFLDARQALIDAVPLFRGTLTQTSVYPRELVKTALALNAAAVVVAHNRPSPTRRAPSTPTPREGDLRGPLHRQKPA